MRDIKFRGISNETGEWVYGCLLTTTNTATIIKHNAPQGSSGGFTSVKYSDAHPVDPETVGEYTGLKDMTGREIFEGDRFTDHEDGDYFVCEYDEENAVFVWALYGHDVYTGENSEEITSNEISRIDLYGMDEFSLCEVEGTIHDSKIK